MKNYVYALITCCLLVACNTSLQTTAKHGIQTKTQHKGDTISIANDSLEYEILIIEPGFNTWLAATARPQGYYSQTYLESRNVIYVLEWNRRVLNPLQFNPNLYELQIDYDNNTNYGYNVNYKLYNYFIYFQLKYNQRLGPFVPRI